MNNNIVKTAILTLLASAIIAAPTVSRAQDNSTNAMAASDQSTNAPAKPKKHGSLVANGKVSEVDTNAMTLTVGKHTFAITSETKINKNGEPAVLSDIAVGDKVGVAYKKTADGKFNAATINDGKKPKQ
jgi:Domain of unknown function (DUF5666)